MRVAVIVNDMSEVNIDAALVRDGGANLSRTDEQLVEMSNGCICCTLREDLLIEVSKLAREGRFDYLLIESTGISEPMPVAETFTFTDEAGNSLSNLAQLDTMVTVVDAGNFFQDFGSWDDLADRQLGVSKDDHRNIVDLLVDQIEFANVIIINKMDLISAGDLEQLNQIIHRLNPTARILGAQESRVPIDEVMGTGRFQLSEAKSNPGWLSVPRGKEESETEEYGISHFVYRRRRPFHAARFSEVMSNAFGSGRPLDGVLRSKGLIWLASRNDLAYDWSQAGCSVRMNPGGTWWAAAPHDLWPDDEEMVASITEKMDGQYGDRRLELVFIGSGMNQQKIVAALDQCLLNDAEFSHGPEIWSGFEDPFPLVEMEFENDELPELWQ